MADLNPIVHRRLRAELRKARDGAGLTQQEVADHLDWSLSKIIRIEAGNVNITTTDLRALLQLYGLSPDRVAELVEMARQARTGMWWHGYKGYLPKSFVDYFGYEYASSHMLQYEPLFVPGLLQTSEYTREILAALLGKSELDRVELLAKVRRTRQDAFFARRHPWKLDCILDEAVLHRRVGGSAVMEAQLLRLAEVADMVEGVGLQVIPFSEGAHKGMRGAFAVMGFPGGEDDDVLYFEPPHDSMKRAFRDEIVQYREIFEELRGKALSPRESQDLIRSLAAVI